MEYTLQKRLQACLNAKRELLAYMPGMAYGFTASMNFKAVDSKPLAKEMRRLSLEYEKVRTQLLNSRYDLSRIKIIPEMEPEDENKGSKDD